MDFVQQLTRALEQVQSQLEAHSVAIAAITGNESDDWCVMNVAERAHCANITPPVSNPELSVAENEERMQEYAQELTEMLSNEP